jgi:hypothetical protein
MDESSKFPNVKPFGSAPIGANREDNPEEEYQHRLSQFKIAGRGAGFNFKPRAEDAESATAAREAYLKQRDKERSNLENNEQPKKKGGFISSASKRADGIAQRGKTRA